MTGNAAPATARAAETTRYEDEFALDVRVIEGAHPGGSTLLITSDGCGSSCSGTACNSSTSYPA